MTSSTNETISEAEAEAEKNRLIKLVNKESQKHALIDLTAFINANSFINKAHTHSGFVRSVAYKLEKTGNYEVIALKDWTEFYIKRLSNKPLKDRFPAFYALFFVVLGALFSLGIDYVKKRADGQLPHQEIKTLQIRIDALSDSMGKLQKRMISLQDSLPRTPDSTKR